MQNYVSKTLTNPLQASKPDELVPSEEPKQTGVTVKISSNRNLDVQVQKLKLNEKIVIKVTL